MIMRYALCRKKHVLYFYIDYMNQSFLSFLQKKSFRATNGWEIISASSPQIVIEYKNLYVWGMHIEDRRIIVDAKCAFTTELEIRDALFEAASVFYGSPKNNNLQQMSNIVIQKMVENCLDGMFFKFEEI